MIKDVQKRFPADVTLEELTFLNDKKIDAEIYTYFQICSYPKDGETRAYKKDLGTQKEICEILKTCGKSMSVMTYQRHLKYLIEAGYVIEKKEYYVLPPKENSYLLLPLRTLKFIQRTLKKPVNKVYAYLGQRWKYKQGYLFTRQELAEHTGMKLDNNSEAYETINDYLDNLRNNGLIDFEQVYYNKIPYLKLTDWSTQYHTVTDGNNKNTSQ